MGEFEPFHSAVNRIPVLRRASHGMADGEKLPRDLFSDGPATGHDHLAADRWSGSIDLEMTVRTPLVFGEQKNGVVELPMRGDELVVPPTMVKGMISRAYETLTCSRFRVFGAVENTSGLRRSRKDHSERLTYRADPAAANNLVPGRICTTGDGGLAVEILDGRENQLRTALIRDDMKKGHGTIIREGHPDISADLPGATKKVFQRFRALTPHGQWTRVCITTVQKKGRRKTGKGKKKASTKYFVVTGVWNDGTLEEFFRIPGGEALGTFDAWGYPCRTSPDGRTSRDLCNEKIYERFFFKADENGGALRGRVLPLGASQLDGYAEVLRTYREHREDPGDTHLLNRAAAREDSVGESLTDGDLVFVRLDENVSSGIPPRAARVVDVLPTMVGRRPYSRSPRDLAGDQGVLPLTRRTEASAADRILGYVMPDARTGATGDDVASRGHLSFSMVDTSEVRIGTEEKKLSPLMSPKPTSARRFLTSGTGGPAGSENGSPLAEFYSQGQLLGAAAYPVHRAILDGSGFPESATRPPQASGMDQSNASVRMTVRSWVETGSVLRCTVGFTNLSEDELGALLWVLTPTNLVPPEEREKDPAAVGFLRMGLGKPLGLGVLEVRIADGGLHATQGRSLAARYETLSGCLGPGTPVTDAADFPPPDEGGLRGRPWVRALQRAAFGYSDGVEVRYMTLAENRENNQTDSRTGRPKEGRGLSPVDLCIEAPGPMTVPRPRRKTSEQ